MPTINLNDVEPVKIITAFEAMLDDFNEKIKLEENKYPLSNREKVFVETIRELLNTLDRAYKR